MFAFPGLKSEKKLKKVFKTRLCSSLDFLRLYMYTFSKMEINYELVLTTSKTRRGFDPEFNSWDYLSVALFYFPELNLYLDPFERGSRLGRIDPDYLGQQVLFCHPYMSGTTPKATTRVRLIKKNKAEDNNNLHELYLDLQN